MKIHQLSSDPNDDFGKPVVYRSFEKMGVWPYKARSSENLVLANNAMSSAKAKHLFFSPLVPRLPLFLSKFLFHSATTFSIAQLKSSGESPSPYLTPVPMRKNQNMWQVAALLVIQVIGSLCQDIVPRIPIYYPNASNKYCQKDSLLLQKGLKDELLWAMKMYDSSVKSGVGIVSGTLMQYGDFDECLSVREPLIAQYCLLTITLQLPKLYNFTDPYTIEYSPYVPVWEKLNDRGVLSKQKNNVIKWALCVPLSCSKDDIITSLNEYMKEKNMSNIYSLSFSPGACAKIDDTRISTVDLIFCFIVGFWVFIVIMATVYDFKCFEILENKPSSFLLCFSLRRSVKSLFRLHPPVNGYDMNIISSLHLLPTVAIVFGHRFGMFQMGGISNYQFIETIFKYTEYSMWTNQFGLMVDWFFTISGFMVGVLLPFYYENYKPDFIKTLFNRYIRLTPSLLVITFFYATIYYKTGEGPMWNTAILSEKNNCVDNWWTSLLYIGNYINSERYCMVQTWYLNCDFQLFLITTIIFYIAKNRPALVQLLIGTLLVLCILGSFYATYTWNLTAFTLFYKRMWDNVRVYNYFRDYYIKTHFRAPPYLIGFIVGYTFYERKPNKLSKSETRSLFLGGVLIMLMAYCSGYLFGDPAHYHLGFYCAIYASLITSVWAIGLLMITISLLIGTANPFAKIYTWPGFVPLSKLCYNVFLIHMMLQIHQAMSRRAPSFLTLNEWISRTISDLVLSFILGFLLNIIIEAPPRYIFKYITFKKHKTKENAPV
ncbi:nose resistant to fluoxetine protein 6-like [Lycorma delicatula]|uniref:nose resistant to fluoxetine protein 6-like n=1 Tax=Lycorma delicatula TaxID=130591 RepID=UPI003F513293